MLPLVSAFSITKKYLYTIVNSAPSSGCRVCFPLIAATARGCRSGVALPPASPLSRVCPRRRGASLSGDLSASPALSLRGWGLEVLIRPPSAGRMREVSFPSLVTPVADEGEFTSVSLLALSAWFMRFMHTDFRSKDVAPDFTDNPLTPDRGINSVIPADTWSTGVLCPTVLLTKISDQRKLPYALSYNARLPQAHDLSSTLLSL